MICDPGIRPYPAVRHVRREDHVLEAAVATLAGLVRPGATVFYRIGSDRQPSGFELFGLAEGMHRTYLQRYCLLDPLHPSRCVQQQGSVVTLAGELPETLRSRSVYWQRFLRPHHVVDVMEVLLRADGHVVGAFSLLRFAPEAPFSRRRWKARMRLRHCSKSHWRPGCVANRRCVSPRPGPRRRTARRVLRIARNRSRGWCATVSRTSRLPAI